MYKNAIGNKSGKQIPYIKHTNITLSSDAY